MITVSIISAVYQSSTLNLAQDYKDKIANYSSSDFNVPIVTTDKSTVIFHNNRSLGKTDVVISDTNNVSGANDLVSSGNISALNISDGSNDLSQKIKYTGAVGALNKISIWETTEQIKKTNVSVDSSDNISSINDLSIDNILYTDVSETITKSISYYKKDNIHATTMFPNKGTGTSLNLNFIYTKFGKKVTLRLPTWNQGTIKVQSADYIQTTNALPVEIRPIHDIHKTVKMLVDLTLVTGHIIFFTNGIIRYYPSISTTSGVFTKNYSPYFYGFVLDYITNN